jgi:hypothetical protein
MVIGIVKEIMRLTGFQPKSTCHLALVAHLQPTPEDGKRVADFSGFGGVCVREIYL